MQILLGMPCQKAACFTNYKEKTWPLLGTGQQFGDNEFYSNVVGLNHWQAASPWWECDCQQEFVKKASCPKGKFFKILDPEDQKFVRADTAAALARGPPNHMLFSLPGVTTRCIRGDGLHILFCKGFCSHLCGSILHHFLYHEGKGKQKLSPSDRPAMLFVEVQAIYKRNNAPTRLTNLKLGMVVDPKKPHQNFPKLEADGAETKHFCKGIPSHPQRNGWQNQGGGMPNAGSFGELVSLDRSVRWRWKISQPPRVWQEYEPCAKVLPVIWQPQQVGLVKRPATVQHSLQVSHIHAHGGEWCSHEP